MKRRRIKKVIAVSAFTLGAALGIASAVAKKKKPDSVYENEPEQKNPMEGKKVVFIEDETSPENADGVRGHLEAAGDADHTPGFYEKYVKRCIDVALSFGGLVMLSPVLLGISLAIKIDDPGPVLFTQKRVGKNKQYFKLHKFRSMKMSTPHDVPTHMLENPDQYITKVGRFLRAHSLDELPQIWDIFIGNMSVIGPRPGLWNQDLLTAERDKYGANDVKPGLTGWAQINGRDELEIPEKAKLDGEYVRNIGPSMDMKVFLGSLHVFAKDETVVEGRKEVDEKTVCTKIAKLNTELDFSESKNVLIAGEGSYIGESLKRYLGAFENYHIETIDTLNDNWKDKSFSGFDAVVDVAGIAHVKETDENRQLFYAVNRDLALALANKAKAEGVKQFIYLSSMSVYGLTAGRIGFETKVNPTGAYGLSKLEAEEGLWALNSEEFIVSIVRPPMVYGKNCKGNYRLLSAYANRFNAFPTYDNQRSMVYIDNLSSSIRGVIHNSEAGLYFPQNPEYLNTCEIVKQIVNCRSKRFISISFLNPIIEMLTKRLTLFSKVFGSLTYDKEMNVPESWITIVDNDETIRLSE